MVPSPSSQFSPIFLPQTFPLPCFSWFSKRFSWGQQKETTISSLSQIPRVLFWHINYLSSEFALTEVDTCINWSISVKISSVTCDLSENLILLAQPEQDWISTASPPKRRGRGILSSLTPPGSKMFSPPLWIKRCQHLPVPLQCRRACCWGTQGVKGSRNMKACPRLPSGLQPVACQKKTIKCH